MEAISRITLETSISGAQILAAVRAVAGENYVQQRIQHRTFGIGWVAGQSSRYSNEKVAVFAVNGTAYKIPFKLHQRYSELDVTTYPWSSNESTVGFSAEEFINPVIDFRNKLAEQLGAPKYEKGSRKTRS